MKIVSVEIACRDEDAKYIEKELSELQYGIYSFGTNIKKATKEEMKEIYFMVPEDIINEK